MVRVLFVNRERGKRESRRDMICNDLRGVSDPVNESHDGADCLRGGKTKRQQRDTPAST